MANAKKYKNIYHAESAEQANSAELTILSNRIN
jgi:hypothetical protein